MGVALLLMTTSGLLAVIVSFLFGIKPGKLQIIMGYAAYLLPASVLLFVNRRKQLYVSAIDVVVFVFFAMVFVGLAVKVFFYGQAEAIRNLFYFCLFMCMPFLLGRVFVSEAVVLYERVLLGLLFIVFVMMGVPGAVVVSEKLVRPIVFSTEYSTISLSFAFGLGALVSVWKGCVAETRRQAIGYGLLLILFMSVLSYIVLRGSYYLTVICAAGLLYGMRDWKKSPLVLAALVLGVLLGWGFSYGSLPYHEKLIHPDVQQLPLHEVYLDFFSPDAWSIVSGRSVLEHVNCLPMVESNDSAMIRVLLYLEALKLFFSAPVFGVGVSDFSQFSCFSPHGFPHSTVLHVAAEMGLVGLGLFLWMLWKSFSIIRDATFNSELPRWIFFAFLYYFCLDQIYGSYFFSSVTYFMIGLASRHSLVTHLGKM